MKGEFYKMDYEAWDEGTIDLSLELEGAYLRLCHQMYRRHGEVPNSQRLLQVIWRCNHTRAAAMLRKLVEAGKIIVTDDGKLTNPRVKKELEERAELSAKRRSAAKQTPTNRGANPDQTPSRPGANDDQPPTNPGADLEQTRTIRGPNSAKSLKNNDVDEAIARTPTSQRREEKRREEERREEFIGASRPAGDEDDKKSTRGSRLSRDWEPSADDVEAARNAGLNDRQIRDQADRFRDYWIAKPGKDAVKLDWSATWRNWIRRSAGDAPRGGGSVQRGVPAL